MRVLVIDNIENNGGVVLYSEVSGTDMKQLTIRQLQHYSNILKQDIV